MASGLVVAATNPLRSFLSSAAASQDLPADLRDLASPSLSSLAFPTALREIWCAASPDIRLPLRRLLDGTDFLLSSPKPREKSDELKARLDKLREMQERKEYADLVRDVAPTKEDSPEPFSSYKDQIGFGLDVVLIMFTGYLVGFVAFRALFNNSPVMVSPQETRYMVHPPFLLYSCSPSLASYFVGLASWHSISFLQNSMTKQNAAGGILGLVGGMLMETVLFIIRSSSKELASSSVPIPKKVQ